MPKKGHKDRDGVRRRFPGSSRSHNKADEGSVGFWSRQPLKNKAGISLFVAISMAVGVNYWIQSSYMREVVRLPLKAAPIMAANATSPAVDPEKFWGTYRPGTYFGLKTRSPHSPVVGLMWMTQMTGEMPPPIRHWCEQGDQLPMYGWFAHDGVNFGIQEILDKYYAVSTDFVKRPGGSHGGDWSARVRINARPGAEEVVMSLFFYIALDGQGRLSPELKNHRLSEIKGRSAELGDFKLVFPKSSKANIKYNHHVSLAPDLKTLKENMMAGLSLQNWDKAKGIKYLGLGGTMMPKDVHPTEANFIVLQLTFDLPFEYEIIFESGSAVRENQLNGAVLQNQITAHLTKFDAKFERIFGLQSKGYSQEEMGFAKAALSNMIGGIGYFYGQSIVKSPYAEEPRYYWPAPLYTAVPSRSFFPRGFLWDEGFHNVLISRWDMQISEEIIGHWLDLMNDEGWIPREQILGDEARAKVPAEYVVQHNQNANPPTLFLPLQRIVKKLIKSEDPEDKKYLAALYPRLRKWYEWFNTTQIGTVPSSYRWRGRDAETKFELNPKTLSSGLDDYPRASHPTANERHVDLRCWMALASGVMADITQCIGVPSEMYEADHKYLTDNKLLDALHWSEKAQRYADYGLHSDSVRLEYPKPPNLQPGQRPPPREKERVTKKAPQMGFVDSTFGYVSLFPFLLKIVDPESIKLGKIIQDLQDPQLLWSKYGLRSLAKNSPLYNKHNTEHDPPYWRGAIWININYLALGALHHYGNTPGPNADTAQQVYKELRANIVNNIYSQYRKTGYIWEQYDDSTGRGKGCHPFTGWSALVVAIMAEEY